MDAVVQTKGAGNARTRFLNSQNTKAVIKDKELTEDQS